MNTLVQPDPGLYIWTIVTFLVLVAALAKFAWRPLLEALERRQDAIRKSLDDAQKAKQELERLHVESQRILAAARTEADQILSNTRSDANRFREELKQKAQAEAAGIVKNAETPDRARNGPRASADSNGGRRYRPSRLPPSCSSAT